MFVRRCICLILSLASVCAGAARPEDESDVARWMKTDRENAPPPTEQEFTLPDLATLKEWRGYAAGRAMGSSRVEIAVDSMSLGKEDHILRYAIAVIPKSGLRNVFFEGLDCFSSRYRAYAWGMPDQTWRKFDKGVWRVAQGGTINAWQGELINDFCGDVGPYALDAIQKSVRKGELSLKSNN